MFKILNEFVRRFEILPSTSKLSIKVEQGKCIIMFTSPKIVKKGAMSPKDTLVAIYNFTQKISEIGEEGGLAFSIEPLLNTTVTLTGDVKAYFNDTEVSSVKFGDIPKLDIKVIEDTSTYKHYRH